MKKSRRDFIKISGLSLAAGSQSPFFPSGRAGRQRIASRERDRLGQFEDEYLDYVAFPLGGIGAGMFCFEGTGAFSSFSLRNKPDVHLEPFTFAALSVKGIEKGAKILEGPVPSRKVFGPRLTGNGAAGRSYGFPRFQKAAFLARFPFAHVRLDDSDIPLDVEVTAWSPFVPGRADDSSLPLAACEYRFVNRTRRPLEAVFSYHAKNFMATGDEGHSIRSYPGGFELYQEGGEDRAEEQGSFVAFVDSPEVVVDHCWFRGGWWDPATICWKTVREGTVRRTDPVQGKAPGASLYLPFSLQPGEELRIPLLFAWFVPRTELRLGEDPEGAPEPRECEGDSCCPERKFHVPWYAGQFESVAEVADSWRSRYGVLREGSARFRDRFFDSTLPVEVIEAVAANLSILKSPTVRRQCDGKLWCYEGCGDDFGCCHGSCTHVWNYAQAVSHLFPDLERSLRETEFGPSQNEEGHQVFRSSLPIRPTVHTFHAASDGQLGGIMKMYREWRISGDTDWLRRLWPRVRESLEYCIRTWDPREKGVLEEPHHNTYDIEFWGPDGMCTSFYLGALAAAAAMGEALGEKVERYRRILASGRRYMESELFNGEYFFQQVRWTDLDAKDPVEEARQSGDTNYSPEALELLQEEGPKYQYGEGCLSDSVVGLWLAQMCGLGELIDPEQVRSNLQAVYRYNLKKDLSDHVNPQRPSFAMGEEGGLLLCTWPRGGRPSLPFVYSNEVWTGIEYQVAGHLILEGHLKEGLEIVRTCRARYDGRVRNPFDEYECGHWYARALSSYGLLQALTGVRYDGVEKTLFIDSQVGDDFRTFFSAQGAYGTVSLKGGRPFVDLVQGELEIDRVLVSGEEVDLSV